MSLSKEVDEFMKYIQDILKSKQIICFDSYAKKLSDEVNRKFKSWKNKPSMIWKSIQTFHSDYSKFKLKELQFQILKEVKENHPDKTNSQVDEIVKNLLKDGGFYSKHSKDRDQYLSEKAEHRVDEAISLVMLGHPGLLIRGLKCEGKTTKKKKETEISGTFSHLKEFLGDIAPNCKGECGGKHQNDCYNFEADIILLYPKKKKKINVVLIEVKRSSDPNKLSESLMTEALVQLKKDAAFILQLLQDVPSENLKIDTFIAFPEAEYNVVEDLFTVNQLPSTFHDNILTKTDFTSNKIKDKLKLDFCQSENVHFLSACARLRGHQNLTISNKEQKDWMLKYEGNIEKQLIMFDEEQRKILNNLESKSDIKHFAFRGGSGTGKTLVALKSIDLLIRRYINQGHTDIFVYALTCQEEPDKSDLLPLVKDFGDKISKKIDKEFNLRFRCETMNELVYEFENLPIKNWDQRIWHLATWKSGPTDLVDTLQSLVKSLKFLHHRKPLILFLDEIYETESHNLLGFDFSNFEKESLLNIIMVFNPILQTHHSNAESDVPFHGTSNVGMMNKTFLKRYRNSEKIQKLTKFVGDKLDIYLKTNEDNSSCVPGKYPVWIDLGFKSTEIQFNLQRALKKVLQLMEETDVRLLYDGHFEEEIRSLLVRKPLKHFKKTIIAQDEKCYRGCESAAVVYIGSGHLEAFSRAKLELGIILCCNLSTFEDRFNKYRDALSMASEDIIKQMPDEYKRRDADKFRYRYPRGESYEDLVIFFSNQTFNCFYLFFKISQFFSSSKNFR
mgnify:CR=1 FL=1